MTDYDLIAVIGAGTMGNGIAQVAAHAGYEVVLRDIDEACLDRGLETIERQLSRHVLRGKMDEAESERVLERINCTLDLSAVIDADFVIEAVIEDRAIKKELFHELDRLTRDEVILASNTSSISITELAAVTERPEKVIGMHFMNPVPVMKLVEVICGYDTSEETTNKTVALAEKLGKTAVQAEDYPGFISNRILAPMINEAIFALGEGVGTTEAIDSVMKLGMNHPMGPLELADLIGLDVVLSVLDVLYNGFRDPKYRPAPLLCKMVAARHLGRKTGRGFYEYKKQ